MGCQSTTVKSCTWHIDMNDILNAFKVGKTTNCTNGRMNHLNKRLNDQKELAELIENAPPEDVFSLLAAGKLIDWTVLQHMCIIARAPPTAKSGERLHPIHCACVKQRNEEKQKIVGGKRKRKRNKNLERGYSLDTLGKWVALTLWLDKVIWNKQYDNLIQRLSACQARIARKKGNIKNDVPENSGDITWAKHQAYLDDVRELVTCAEVELFIEFTSKNHEGWEVEKDNGNSLQEQNGLEKGLKRLSADQENSLVTQAMTHRELVMSKKQEKGSSKEIKTTSIAKKESKQSRSNRENNSRLRIQDTDHGTRENLAIANKPDQSTKEVFRVNGIDTDCAATITSAASTPLRRSSRKRDMDHWKGAVDDRISHSYNLTLSSKNATDETSVKSNSALPKSGLAEPKLGNKSKLFDTDDQSQPLPAHQLKNDSNFDSDVSDISSLTTCPSSPTTFVAPSTPDSTSPVYEMAKATYRSNSKSIVRASRDDSKYPQRSSFCLQYMKPHVAETAYGLIQEALVDDPFALLVAVTLLNRTKGIVAVPIFFTLMSNYSTPEKLAAAPISAIVAIIGRLGLQNNRAKSLIGMARRWWCDDAPPRKGFRYRTLHYPEHGAGSSICPGEIVADEADDPREGAFEIGHLPGVGPYALDSWRIFCRDMLRGLANGYNGEGAEAGIAFEPEWKRVLPKDKELRGFLKWMWAKDGVEWDPVTGRKRRI